MEIGDNGEEVTAPQLAPPLTFRHLRIAIAQRLGLRAVPGAGEGAEPGIYSVDYDAGPADSGDDELDDYGDAATVIVSCAQAGGTARSGGATVPKPTGEPVLLRQRVSFETVEGLSARRECEIYGSDTVTAIESRLRSLGASALPTMRVTAVSIQFYDRDRKEVVEVGSASLDVSEERHHTPPHSTALRRAVGSSTRRASANLRTCDRRAWDVRVACRIATVLCPFLSPCTCSLVLTGCCWFAPPPGVAHNDGRRGAARSRRRVARARPRINAQRSVE